MSIIRSPRKDRGFTIVSNAVAQDARLSMRALGLLVRLLSRPDNWETNSTTLAAEFGVGREQMQGVLRELSGFGYMALVKERKEDGTFFSRWYVYDEPEKEQPEHGKPAPENPYSGKPVSINKNRFNKEPIQTPHTPSVAGGHVDQKKPSAVSLETWLDNIKSKGEQPIPPTDPVFAYAEQAGIPMEHMRLAWAEFRARYTEPGAKRYRDWRTVYRKAVRGNWFKLWFCTADGEYALTTTGTQALRTMQAKQAAREGVEA